MCEILWTLFFSVCEHFFALCITLNPAAVVDAMFLANVPVNFVTVGNNINI